MAVNVDKALYEAPVGIGDEEPVMELEIAVMSDEPDDLIEMMLEGETGDVDFAANLAEHLDEETLTEIAADLIEAVDSDLASRQDWEETYQDGLELLGLRIEDRSEPWDGAFGVYHPLLAEAVVKFQSETIVETFPAQGPVKTKILGETTRETEDAAARVREDMNNKLTEEMPDYRSEHERLLWNLPIAGSAFKKVYFDPTLDRPVSEMVPAEDFIVSYGASSLETAQRYTHRLKRTKNELRKMQVNGFYRDVDLGDPVADNADDVQKRKDKLSGYDAVRDDRHTFYEVHCYLDIPGFEDVDEMGEMTGVELPYVVTVDRGSNKVLSIYRNWQEDDTLKRKRIHFSHYTYIPGFGFYGLGLIHLVGGFAKGATSIMRQLVDAGTLANLPGGFRTRGLRIKGGDTPIAPGEFRDVDVPTGTIKENIMSLPYKEPSAVLAQLLDKIVNEARRFAAVSDVNVADLQPNAPVGSTLAVLERTLKTMTAIQARVHAAMKLEFKILKNIISEHAPSAYEYDAVGQTGGMARREDYEAVEIIPVSDPNASTMSQRIVQYQAVLQLAQQAPQIYDLPLLHRQMIETLGVKNAGQLVPDKMDHKPMDPVSENMQLLMGKPVKAFAHQDHEAHISAHMAFGQDPKIQSMLQMQGEAAAAKMAAGMAHINEHLAYLYRNQIEEQLGVPMPAPTVNDEQSENEYLPPEAEIALSRVVASAAQKLLSKHQQEAQQDQAQKQAEDPVLQMQKEELQLKRGELERKAQKDQMDYRINIAKVEIEAERVKSQEKSAGAATGAKMAADRLKADTELKKAGVNAGVQLHNEKQRSNTNLKQTGAQIGAKAATPPFNPQENL